MNFTFPHLRVPVQCRAGAKLPIYSTSGASGADIFAHIESDVEIASGKLALIPTGISVEIPAGFEIQVRPRSGLALKKGIGILNAPGTIDADFRGEIQVILINCGSKSFTVQPGMRIAQLVLAPVYHIAFVESKLGSTIRGQSGFGQTGFN